MYIIIQEGELRNQVTSEKTRGFVCFYKVCCIFGVPEVWQSWSIAPVLKTGVPKGTGGSNPSASAK